MLTLSGRRSSMVHYAGPDDDGHRQAMNAPVALTALLQATLEHRAPPCRLSKPSREATLVA